MLARDPVAARVVFCDDCGGMERTRRPDFATFVRVARFLSSSLDLDVVLRELLTGLDRLLRPTNWSLLLREDGGDGLVFRLVSRAGDQNLAGQRLEPGEGIAGWVLQNEQAVLVRNPASDARFSGRFDKMTGFATRSIVAVPLKAEGHVLGVIELVNQLEDHDFTSDDFQILEAFADFAAIAIQNAQTHGNLLEASRNDPLSGLRNSRYFLHCVERAVHREERFSVVFCDMDRFKALVDAHGHMRGSEALAEVGQVVRAQLGKGEIGCRFGGDEFAFLLPGVEGVQAQARCDALAATIRDHVFLRECGISARLGASFGWAAHPDDAGDADALVRLADERMYAAKRAGNRAR